MRGLAPWVGRAVRGASCLIPACLILAVAVPGPAISIAAAATAEPKTVRVSVKATQVWTDTGIALRAGDTVEVRASGVARFGTPPINRITPPGLPRNGYCATLSSRGVSWPAPKLPCWSLIARIDTAPAVLIGNAKTFRATRAGELFLGINDNYLVDNAGAWPATARVTPGPGSTETTQSPSTTAPPTPTTAASSDSSSGSSSTIVIAIGAAILVALLALLALVLRRRAAARRAAQEVRELAPVGAVAAADDGDLLPTRRAGANGDADVDEVAAAPATPVIAEPVIVGGPTDVNIFEVEFPDLMSLRVGYSYFPEGTLVQWRVRQNAATSATGEFVARGGGSANHFVTLPLDSRLEATPGGADVEFTWSIGGVPFGYSVRREPRV